MAEREVVADRVGRVEAAVKAQSVALSSAADEILARPVVDAVLRANAAALPQAVGIDLAEEGYAVARITKTLGRDPIAADTARAQEQYAQAWGNAETMAYYDALKTRLKVRRDQVLGSQRAIDAIDSLFEASGGRALANGTYLQRAWRDAHAGRVHAANDPERALQMYGAHEFGHKIDPGMY